MSRFNEKLFIEKFVEKKGDGFVYLGYENGRVKFLCKKHNIISCKTPSHVLRHVGCIECGEEKRKQWRESQNQKTKENFIKRAQEVHGNKYDYSKTNYVDGKTKVCIICPEHGEFYIMPHSHLSGRGCRKCAIKSTHDLQRKSLEQFIKEAREVHGDKYDYSKVNYVNCDSKVCIICPEHGEFWQQPFKHLAGQGCKKCGISKNVKNQTFTTEEFIERAKEVHGDKYDYSKVEYKGYDKEVCIICPTHGEFWQTPDSHLQGSNCQMCARQLSKNEKEIHDFIADKIGDENVIKERSILKHGAEIDIFIPSLHLGIEYDGCRWHSELFGKDRHYHLKKTEECKKQGISLIHIFEDEYNNKKEIVLSKIQHLIKCSHLPKINGRKCCVSQIDYNESKDFLNANHIQGSQRATVYLGAKYNNELVGVMTFVKVKGNEWELNRFASNIKYICQGVGGKLFSFFVKNYAPEQIKSFADRRWTTDESDNLYTKLGFELKETLKPDYRYVFDGYYNRIHKFNFRKETLHKKYGLPLELTESEMAKQIGAYKIWDCGLYKYVWTNNQTRK